MKTKTTLMLTACMMMLLLVAAGNQLQAQTKSKKWDKVEDRIDKKDK